jgi:DNA polymerase-1
MVTVIKAKKVLIKKAPAPIDLFAMKLYAKPGMHHMTESNVDELIEWMGHQSKLVVDVETTGIDLRGRDEIFGIGIGTKDIQWWIPNCNQIEDSAVTASSSVSFYRFISALEKIPALIAYNLKFDMAGLLMKCKYNPPRSQEWIDIMPMVRMVLYDHKPNMKATAACTRFVGPSEIQYDYFFKKQITKSNKLQRFDYAGEYNLGTYCMGDIYSEALVFNAVLTKIKDWQLTGLYEHHKKLTKTLMNAENIGMYFDREYCQRSYDRLSGRMLELQSEINDLAGRELDIARSTDVANMFHGFGIKSPVITEKGNESWDKNVLKLINHPVAVKIREFRALGKLGETYFANYLAVPGNVLHPQFKNWGTRTGRLSCGEPNVQNLTKMLLSWADLANYVEIDDDDEVDAAMPMDFDKAAKMAEFDENVHLSVRRVFIPRPGYTLVGFDYKQIEMRVLFSFLNNNTILREMEDPTWDAHDATAKLIWDVVPGDDTFEYYRQIAKTINFALVYGIGNKALAKSLEMTQEIASEFKKTYMEKIPEMKAFQEKILETLNIRGYVKNRYGRRSSVSPDQVYKLTNYIVQGTSGEFVCERMNALDEFLADKKTNMISQVHDEVVFEVHSSEMGVLQQLKDILEEPTLGVLLPVDMNFYNPSFVQKAKITLEEAMAMKV